MASVWKRLQRVGKNASKFQFVASYQELMVECTKKWYVLFFIVSRVVTGVQLLKPHEKCVSVGMLSSFMVTHTQCWCAGMSACWEGSLVKLLCFFLLLRQSCLDLIGKHSSTTPKSVFSPEEENQKQNPAMLFGSSPNLWPYQMSETSSCCAFLIIFCTAFLFCFH